jgi:hypothetical protein
MPPGPTVHSAHTYTCVAASIHAHLRTCREWRVGSQNTGCARLPVHKRSLARCADTPPFAGVTLIFLFH